MATQKATLINSAGKKVVVESGSADAQKYFGEGYQLMGAGGKYVAPTSNVSVEKTSSTNVNGGTTTKATLINNSGQKVVVDSGSPEATAYFKQGYSLMGADGKADLTATINSGQDETIANKENADTPGKSKSQIAIEKIKTEITPTETTKPDTLNLEKTYTDLTTKYGVTDLETQLNDLKNSEDELRTIATNRKDYAESKPVALGVIGGRQEEVDRQTDKQLTENLRQQNYLTNQLKVKYDIIGNLMNLKSQDYANSLAAYNTEYANNLALLTMVNSQETTEKNNARADYTIMVNALNDNGIALDSISAAQKATLAKLEAQAGMTQGTYETLLKASAGATITSLGVDNNTSGGRSAYFLSTDKKTGIPKIISMPLPGAVSTKTGSGSGSGDETDREKEVKDFKAKAADLIGKLDNGETTWATAYQQLKTQFPGLEGAIDEALGGGYDQSSGQWYGRAVTSATKKRSI